MSWSVDDGEGDSYDYDITNWTDADGNYHECTQGAKNYEGEFSGDWEDIDKVTVRMEYEDDKSGYATIYGPFDGESGFEDAVAEEIDYGDGQGSL